MINMKKYILLLLLVTMAFSCKKSKDNDDTNECLINCFIHVSQFNYRLVDKTTGADLVFGANPRYTPGDVQLFFDAAGTAPIHLMTDTTAKAFKTLFGKATMYLKVGGITYKVDVTWRELDCCTSIVETLKIDGVSVCVHCNEIIEIPVN